MINALGNYIGSSEKVDPLVFSGFISNNIATNGPYGYLLAYYDSGSVSPANGTGSFQFDSDKQVEYFIVGGGGAGLLGNTYCGTPYMLGAGGGGAGGVVSGSAFCYAKQQYTAVAGRGGIAAIASNLAQGGDSYLLGQLLDPPNNNLVRAKGGGYGGPSYAGTVTVPNLLTGSAGGSGGGGGGGNQAAFSYNGGTFLTGTGSFSFGKAGQTGSYQGAILNRVYLTSSADPTGPVPGPTASYNAIWIGAGGGGASQTGSVFTPVYGQSGSVYWMYLTGSSKGGDGIATTITGTTTYYAGGGSGYTYQEDGQVGCPPPGNGNPVAAQWPTGSAALGGGGLPGLPGTPGTGGGGGTIADGGSGVVIIRYNLNQTALI